MPTSRLLPLVAAFALLAQSSLVLAQSACRAATGERLNPVVELYTSEGCSSCPPADQWLSAQRAREADTGAVLEAFHVGYWDYIGWVDRFAQPAFTQRQREIASREQLRSLYTPQVVRNGRDWPNWSGPAPAAQAPLASIELRRTVGDAFEAMVKPVEPGARWSAYWTVTENSHASKVRVGENAGAYLQHDFVVRQYTPVGQWRGAQTLRFEAIAATADHARRINLVVFDPATGRPLQALGMACG